MEISFLLFVAIAACAVDAQMTPPTFNHTLAGRLDDRIVSEASGLCASRKFPGILYTHNDQGDSPRIFAINATTAKVVSIINIGSANNTSWEDIACGPCDASTPAKYCIYILDDGINHGHQGAGVIYRVMEPDHMSSPLNLVPDSIDHFSWGEAGSDTIMVDPNGETFVIGYVIGGRGMIAHIPASSWGASNPVDISSTSFFSVNTGRTVLDPVGGDISPNGMEAVVRTHRGLYWFPVTNGDYMSALSGPATPIPHYGERLPGGICWAADGSAIYTIGEGANAPLYRYDRV